MDCIGPLARTVQDCACLLSVVAGFDSSDSTSSGRPVPDYQQFVGRGIEGVRIAIPDNSYYSRVTDEVRSAIERAIAVLRDLSSEIVRVSIPDISPLNALGDTILKCEGPVVHQKWLHERPNDYSIHARARLDVGLYIPASLYIKAVNLRKLMIQEFMSSVFADAELLLSPCIGFPPPKILETHNKHSKEVASTVASLTWYTRPFSYLGLPSMSVPCGRSQTGLPIAFQLTGPPFSEGIIFQVGDAYQRATSWHLTAPALPKQRGAKKVDS
jgi:aspartyl-tRNA(Asn)/glutamyl-tRNA(Gln) amidotransferase subunit A